jgi:putative FmdB family regulatory protein
LTKDKQRLIFTLKKKSRKESIMPLYEFKCKDCGLNFDKLVSLSEASKKQVCPHCGGKNTKKQLSVFAAKSSSSSLGAPSGGFT